ncbi:helix-turn-helix domain-containing GNAT family N-acetyltransferase [Pseudonocardia eucalypti]|uniref:Helix-turn-helix domain-containing GNAT family N-acetyltransferase n=1 Tax=Pseudonocardia eucalypti TaxID=648755 RepID=A0ABP9PV97_9PSEU
MPISTTLSDGTRSRQVTQVRAFNRFYTRIIGALRANLLDSPFSLVEARIMYELGQLPDGLEGAALRRMLDLDPGYLSRVLTKLDTNGLVSRTTSATDGRRQIIRLTEAGRAAFATLDQGSDDAVAELIDPLDPEQRARLVEAMVAIEQVLGDRPAARGFVLRPPEPGDLGWVVARNGALYAEEFDWDASYEALVARIVADYAQKHDPAREACWIAELHGRRVGAVFCVTDADDPTGRTARLRLLLVEPSARGHGIGERLVDECVRFARRNGYDRMTLWTNSVLASARRIYQRGGFTLDSENEHHSFGQDLVGQTWSLKLN